MLLEALPLSSLNNPSGATVILPLPDDKQGQFALEGHREQDDASIGH